MDFYDTQTRKGEKTQRQYEEEWCDDFAIIEIIIMSTGREGETFHFDRMHRGMVQSLQDMFPMIDDDIVIFSDDDPKDGLRAMLFLMLQVCIVLKGSSLKEDFGSFWKTYQKMLKDKKRRKEMKNVYCPMVKHLFSLTMAFHDELVSCFCINCNIQMINFDNSD